MKFFTIFLLLSIKLFSEEPAPVFNRVFPAASKEGREKYKAELLNSINSEMASFQNKKKESAVKKSFQAMRILNYLEDEGYHFLQSIFNDYPSLSEGFYTDALETVYTLYKTGFDEIIENVFMTAKSPKHFAIAVNYKLRNNPGERLDYLNFLKLKYDNYDRVPVLKILAKYLEISPSEYLKKRPPLQDLFSNNYGEGTYILFSLQRLNRDYPGLCIIKKTDGTFLRRSDGSIFSISQLARSVSDLPSYIVNGNTPQGIYSIQNITSLKNEEIGPTPSILTALPIEITAKKFFHRTKQEKWNLNSYLSLLPDSWKEYFPMQEAYIAGEIGRNAIFAHGTTVDTEFFKDYSYYPGTPTAGCLSAKEIWSKKDGKCIYSDQALLVDAINSMGKVKGFMIVLNLDAREMPVTVDEILMDILNVEENLKEM